jgi:hypothetical protein
MAAFARYQGAIVADNIIALAQGRFDLAHYKSAGVAIAVPIGPMGGAGQFPGRDEIVGREIIAEKMGRGMVVDRLRERFGLATPAARCPSRSISNPRHTSPLLCCPVSEHERTMPCPGQSHPPLGRRGWPQRCGTGALLGMTWTTPLAGPWATLFRMSAFRGAV